jgi:TonB-dependent starch-binding outer membrane protein SusC
LIPKNPIAGEGLVTRSFVRRAVWLIACAAGLWPPAYIAAQATDQGRVVSGTVTRAVTGGGGPPISYATVLIKGTTRGTQTDAAGRFHLNVPDGPAQLTIRAIGSVPREVTVAAGDQTIAVVLDDDPAELEQIVVTGQATGISRKNAPTSTAVVDSASLTRAPATTVDEALQGKVPGANIQTNSGAPGGGVQIQIRGVNTAIGASDPLFVVDGIIFSNETVPTGLFTVTKSGSLSGSGPLQDDGANRLADLNPEDIASIEILKSAAASSIYGSKAANGVVIITTKRGQAGKPKADITQRVGAANLLRGPAERRFSVAQADSVYSAATVQPFLVNGTLPFYDHLNEVEGKTPIDYETLLDLSGGNERTRYYASGDIDYTGGIIGNTDNMRQTLRVNLDQQLSRTLEANFSANYAHNNADRGFVNNDNSGASVPYALAYIPSFENIRPQNGIYPQLPLTYLSANPLQTIADGQNTDEVNRFTGGGTANYNALTTDHNSLRLVAAGGLDFFTDNSRVVAPSNLFFEANQPSPGVSTLASGDSRQYNWNLNAIHTLNEPAFRATSSIGTTFEDRELDLSNTSVTGLAGGAVNVNEGTVPQLFEEREHERTFSVYGQEQVSALNERLLVEVGLRAERSSANGSASAYFLYPKIAAAYNFPNLLGAGSNVKLRADEGITGNQPLFAQKFTLLQSNTAIGGVTATGLGNNAAAGDANIQPETTREYEFGTDIAALTGRLDLEVTYFHRETSNLFLPRTPAPSTGFASIVANGGVFENQGIEIGGTLVPIRTRHFSWTFGTSFTSISNDVISLPFPSFTPATPGFGLAFGQFLVQPGRPITQLIGQTSVNPNGVFNVTYMGQLKPDYDWSWSNDFTYHQFGLSMLWDWQKGGVEQNQTLSLYDFNELAADDGTPAGAARVADAFNGIATPFVQATTFLKLREVRLSYTLSPTMSHRFFGSDAVSLNVSGRNLILVTNYYGYDPEVSNYGQASITRGIDLAPYPPSRTFFFSVNARL